MAKRMITAQIGPSEYRKLSRAAQQFDLSDLPLWSDGRKQAELFECGEKAIEDKFSEMWQRGEFHVRRSR